MECSKNKQAVAIVCGGVIKNTEWLKTQLSFYDYIIAADSGYDKCIECGIDPHLIVGDFDSVCSQIPIDIRRLTFPSRKNKTDFMLCLEYCIEQQYDNVTVFGALGGRIDHSLGAIFALVEVSERNLYPKIVTESSTVFVVRDRCTVPKNNGYASIFALCKDAIGVTLKGFDYPLDNAMLKCCSQLGVSNKIIDNYGEISLKHGILLVVLQD